MVSLAAEPQIIDMDMQMDDGLDYMPIPGGIPVEERTEIPRSLYEGAKGDVSLQDGEKRPGGQSSDPDNIYFWKMSKDKRTIDVIVPIEDCVRSEDIVYRLGDDPKDIKRGPTLELGYRKKNENGRYKEKLVVQGQILHAINRQDSYWTIEEMAGVPVCVLTLVRPSMMRQRHDTILRRSVEEERIEPQTWDALLVEERLNPTITDRVYMDISLDGTPAGRLVIGLYGKVVPKTVNNFLGLVTGEYVDDNGNTCKSAHCYKKTHFGQILEYFLISAGNPGLDLVLIKFTPEELKEYMKYYEDFRNEVRKVGKVEKQWAIRWGADLGLPVDEDGVSKKEASAVDGNSENELAIVVKVMRDLDAKGEGASFIFFRPEWSKGCDVTGGTFPAENFKAPHARRGMLCMDRNEDKDEQGSIFFITLKEFPEMDGRWCVFGEVLEGMQLVNRIEEEFESLGEKVVIEDCGVLEEP